jgi:hypothetical protein
LSRALHAERAGHAVQGPFRNALDTGEPLVLLSVQGAEAEGVVQPRLGILEGGPLVRVVHRLGLA